MKTRILVLLALPLLALHVAEPALARRSESPTMPTVEPSLPPGTNATSATPADLPVREEQSCCNGIGGPIEEEAEVVVEHFADPDGEWRRWVAPTDPSLERRYAPRPAPSLIPITLRF